MVTLEQQPVPAPLTRRDQPRDLGLVQRAWHPSSRPDPHQQVNVSIAGHDHLAEDPLTPAPTAILDALNLTPQ